MHESHKQDIITCKEGLQRALWFKCPCEKSFTFARKNSISGNRLRLLNKVYKRGYYYFIFNIIVIILYLMTLQTIIIIYA